MNDHAWLRRVLDDAKAAKELWPDWAKDSDEQTKILEDTDGSSSAAVSEAANADRGSAYS